MSFWAPFSASILADCVTTAGLFVIRNFEPWGRQNTTYFASFAAGVLISVSFLHIIPTAFAMSSPAPVYLLVGYLLMHVLNRFMTAYVCDRHPQYEWGLFVTPPIGYTERLSRFRRKILSSHA